MKRTQKIITVFFISTLFITCDASLTNTRRALAWQLLPRVGALDESKRNDLREVLNMAPNYGECRDAILQCIFKETPDQTAVRIANFCAYLLSKGVPPQALGFIIEERAKFANQKKPHAFTDTDTPSLGNPKAEITIIEFAEFKCTYCVALSPILKQLVAESNGTVQLLFKHFPIKSHQGSVTASIAAQAAHRQGKFWEMYDLLFTDFNRQSLNDLMQYAQGLGLDIPRFKADMEDPKLVALIEKDKMEGVMAGVKGTPTLFINGKMFNLRNDEAFLKDIINEEVERLGKAPPYKDWDYGLPKR